MRRASTIACGRRHRDCDRRWPCAPRRSRRADRVRARMRGLPRGERNGGEIRTEHRGRRADTLFPRPLPRHSSRHGNRDAGMPAFALSHAELDRARRVHHRVAGARGRAPRPRGDVRAGEGFYYGAGGCSGCHMIRGDGGRAGPDLSNLGARAPHLSRIDGGVAPPGRGAAKGISRRVRAPAGWAARCADWSRTRATTTSSSRRWAARYTISPESEIAAGTLRDGIAHAAGRRGTQHGRRPGGVSQSPHQRRAAPPAIWHGVLPAARRQLRGGRLADLQR